MTGVFVLYTGFAFFLALKNPTYFSIFYLLSSSKFLGFFDAEQLFVFSGLGLASPALNIIALISALVHAFHRRMPRNMFIFTLFIFVFILYGLGVPLLSQTQSFLQSIIASKQYWSIFLFVYLALNCGRINIDLLLGAIKFLGLAISLSYIIHLVTGIAAPFYSSYGVFRAFYPTFISLSLFIGFYELVFGRKRSLTFILWLGILATGMVIAGHESLVYATLLCLILSYLYINKRDLFAEKLLVMLSVCIIFAISMLLIPELTESIKARVSSVIRGEDAALSSRAIYNEFRWQAINDNPFGGYGFVHHSADIVSQYRSIEDSRFAESFGVIDSGYVDLLITFGYIGTLIYLSVLAFIVLNSIKRYRSRDVLKTTMAFYLLQYFLVNYTWSVWSFSHGLVPGFVALFLIMRKGNDERTA